MWRAAPNAVLVNVGFATNRIFTVNGSSSKNPTKDFCSEDLDVHRWCTVVNGSLNLAARAIVLQAFYFTWQNKTLIQSFRCATADESGQRRARSRALKSGRTLRFFRVDVLVYQSVPRCLRAWRIASTKAFALYVIVAGCGRAPNTFPKRTHRRACSRLVRIM